MSTITPNMSLIEPSVGYTSGPDYALQINQSLTLIDQHDHTPGKGTQISTAGININADFSFNNFAATNVSALTLTPQSAVTTLNSLYDIGGDLYFNDGIGNVIRFTQAGSIAGTPGSISGLTPPASATYVPISSTFVWQSGLNKAANMDAGSYLFRNLTPNSTFALTLAPPAALAANYTLTLPALPATSTSFMTMDTSGQMLTSQVYPLTAPGIATSAVTTSKINDAAVTLVKQAPLTASVSASSGSQSVTRTSTTIAGYTVASVTVTSVAGRPIMLFLAPNATDAVNSRAYVQSSASGSVKAYMSISRSGAGVWTTQQEMPITFGPAVTSQGGGSSAPTQFVEAPGGTGQFVITNNSGIAINMSTYVLPLPTNYTWIDPTAVKGQTYTYTVTLSLSGNSGSTTILASEELVLTGVEI